MTLEAALAYAARGWYVFPAPAGKKKSHKKAEFSAGANWGKTRDPEQIKRDFAQWPNANVGLPTGKDSGFWVMEADTAKGHGVDGLASIKELQEKHGPLPKTLMAESPSGSQHYYFNWPAGASIKNSSSRIATGIDVRGEGGMVIAPPSMRSDGQYRWLNDLPIADAPGWLIDLVAGEAPDNVFDFPAPDWLVEKAKLHAGRGVSTDAEDLPPKATVEEINAALAVIPASCSEEEWWRIAAALYDELGETGFGMFHDWSATGGASYKGKRDCLDKWRHSASKTDIHIGTLFRYASEYDASWRDGVKTEPEHDAEADDTEAKAEGTPTSDLIDATMKVVCLSSVKPRAIDWAWPGRFARGKLAVIAGNPDDGKSAFTLGMSANVTTAGPWPNGEGNAPLGSVILLSAEDEPDDTIRPRFAAAGGDADKVYLLQAIKEEDRRRRMIERTVNLGRDVAKIEQLCEQVGDVALIVIDPLNAYMGRHTEVNTWMDADIRSVLAPLAAMAARVNAVVLLVCHNAKGARESAMMKVMGTIATVAASRSTYLITRDQEDRERRLFLPIKCNIAKPIKGLAYRLVDAPTGLPEVPMSFVIEWEKGCVDMTADEAVEKKEKRDFKWVTCAKIITEMLDEKEPRPAAEVEKRLRDLRFGDNTVRKAKRELGVESSQPNVPGPWFWRRVL